MYAGGQPAVYGLKDLGAIFLVFSYLYNLVEAEELDEIIDVHIGFTRWTLIVGNKQVSDQKTDTLALVIGVEQKEPLGNVPLKERIPSILSGKLANGKSYCFPTRSEEQRLNSSHT